MRYPRNKKNILIFAVVAVLSIAVMSLYFFLPVYAKNILKDDAAIAIKSLYDTFGPSSGSYLTAEINISGDEVVQSASDVASTADFASSSDFEAADTSTDANFSDSLSNSPPKKLKKKNTTAQLSSRNFSPPSSSQKIVNDTSEVQEVTASVPKKSPPATCNLSDPKNISHKIIINEIAWMGSQPISGETVTKATGREWIELKNISEDTVSLSGWQMTDESGNLKVAFQSTEELIADGFFLLERGDAPLAGMPPDKIYSGALSNSGDAIFLFDDHCALSDSVDARVGWTEGSNTTKQTMERDVNDFEWHTSAVAGGSPGAENSSGSAQEIAKVASDTLPTPDYLVAISLIGDGRGMVTSTPPGIICGITCLWSFSGGHPVVLRATPDAVSFFGGWSGACSGMNDVCSFAATGSVAVTALFNQSSSPPLPPPPPPVATSTDDGGDNATSTGHLMISAIQIAGASSTNDFVELFNPTSNIIHLGGWKLRKKASTGSDQSLREFPDGSAIAPHESFVWANSAGGFSESIQADASSTATLAVANSIAIMNTSGTILDAVAWGKGVNQYVEGDAYPTDPLANQVLRRILVDGVMIDNDDNANDFTI